MTRAIMRCTRVGTVQKHSAKSRGCRSRGCTHLPCDEAIITRAKHPIPIGQSRATAPRRLHPTAKPRRKRSSGGGGSSDGESPNSRLEIMTTEKPFHSVPKNPTSSLVRKTETDVKEGSQPLWLVTDQLHRSQGLNASTGKHSQVTTHQ